MYVEIINKPRVRTGAIIKKNDDFCSADLFLEDTMHILFWVRTNRALWFLREPKKQILLLLAAIVIAASTPQVGATTGTELLLLGWALGWLVDLLSVRSLLRVFGGEYNHVWVQQFCTVLMAFAFASAFV